MIDEQKFLDLLKQHETALVQYRETQKELDIQLEKISDIQIELDKMINEFKQNGPPQSHWYYQYMRTGNEE